MIEEKDPTVIALVETKLSKEDELKIEGYIIERVDRDENGGGVLIAYKECLEHVVTVVCEERENCEILWIKFDNGQLKLKIAAVYMPQENQTKIGQLRKLYKNLEKEIMKSQLEKESVMVLGDFNCKVGKEIKGNTEEITKAGKLMIELCQNTGLTIVNAEEKCEGLWTRKEGTSKSILDYVLMWKEDMEFLEHMKIDKNHEYTPYSVDCSKIVYSDHFAIDVMMNWIMKLKGEKKKVLYMGPEEYEKFSGELNEIQVSTIIDEENFDESYEAWSKKIIEVAEKNGKEKKRKRLWKANRLLTKAKKKVQGMLRNSQETQDTKEHKGMSKEMLMMRKRLIVQHLNNEDKKRNHHTMNKAVDKIKQDGGVNSTSFWELRSKLMGRKKESKHAIIDEDGVRHDTPEGIKEQHVKYYQKLLTPDKSNKEECAVNRVISGMNIIASSTEAQMITNEDVENIVKKLKKKKAKDRSSWKNELAIYGGEEMNRSLTRIFQIAAEKMRGPKKWSDMTIKSVHKKGSKQKMTNKRGLFLTNIVSKIFERVIKERNKESFMEGLSPNQTGGVSKRSAVDNLLTVLAIIERNSYMNKTTYLTFADVQKCFDSLWLEDGIKELWMSGVNVRDAVTIKNLNSEAKIQIDTPVGKSEEFRVENIVKQGTVYAVDICGAVMAKVNETGYGVRTMYGPDLEIGALAFVDDIVSAGNSDASNNTVKSCNMMETRKKITFNTDTGKSAVMRVKKKAGNCNITGTVQKGRFEEVTEYKLLGAWIDESGRYLINIKKNQKRLPFMINSIKVFANQNNMGKLAISGRMKMMENVLIPGLLHGIEAYPTLTKEELNLLERMQGKVIRELVEVPPTTPYNALLMELGLPTMKARVAYRKLMLYHNLANSDEKRIAKQVIEEQMKMDREGTWMNTVQELMAEYDIEDTVIDDLKSAWKKKVKEKIKTKTEETIRRTCETQSKARTVVADEYKLKEYLTKTTITEAKQILKARLHMLKLPCNYGKNENCWLCGEVNDVSTEHYFNCSGTRDLLRIWNAKEDDLESMNKSKLRRSTKFLEHVVEKFQPKWEL